MNKNDLRVIKTKQTIHKALLFLLKNKPLPHIKITELCKEAAINRGTFYFHYQNVDDVLQELFEEIMHDLQVSYDEPLKKGFDINVTILTPNSVKIFDHVKKYEDFYKIVLSENASMKYYYMLFAEICKLMAKSDFGKKEVHSNYFHAYSANAIIGLLIQWYLNDFKDSVDDMNKQLVEIVHFKMNI
jgi:AcrR family transcriptional regulator